MACPVPGEVAALERLLGVTQLFALLKMNGE
jgi:hypothetical protein